VPKAARPRGSKAEPSLVDLLTRLAQELSDAEIARILNMKRIPTPRNLPWTQERVANFRHQHHIHGPQTKPADTLTQNQAAEYLGIGHNGILGLARLGALTKNQVTDFAPWRVSLEELDSERVRALVAQLKHTGRLPRGGSPINQHALFGQQ
jgi:hypothetical protein